jgi:hypothetical protein
MNQADSMQFWMKQWPTRAILLALLTTRTSSPASLDDREVVRLSIAVMDPPDNGCFATRLDYDGIVIKAFTNAVDDALFAA